MKTLVVLALLALLMAAILPPAKANDKHESDLNKVVKIVGYAVAANDLFNILKTSGNHGLGNSSGSLFPTEVSTGPAIVVMRFAGQDGEIARQEVTRLLQAKGYTPLAAPDSMSIDQIKHELELENSKWGENGVDRNYIGQFRGAKYLISGTVRTVGRSESELRLAAASGTFSAATYEVEIEAYDVASRQMGAPKKGSATVSALTDLDVRALQQSRFGNLIVAEFRQRLFADRTRDGIGKAVANALAGEPMAPQIAPPPAIVTTPPVVQPAGPCHSATGQLLLWAPGHDDPIPFSITSGKEIHDGSNPTHLLFYKDDKQVCEYVVLNIDGKNIHVGTMTETVSPEGLPFVIIN